MSVEIIQALGAYIVAPICAVIGVCFLLWSITK